MSQTNEQAQQIQNLIFSINPLTAEPYAMDSMQVADGQGTRIWKSVFQTISSQSATDGASIVYLPSTVYALTNSACTMSTVVATSYSSLSSQIAGGGIPGSITTFQLQSTVSWVQNDSRYVSSGQLTSSMTPFLNGSLSFMSNIQSTVIGLGSSRYISSPSFFSSITATNLQQQSTTVGLGTYGYISTLSLQSTVNNLGQTGYISSSALNSTVKGLLYPAAFGGSLGVIVTGTTDPPFVNFNGAVSQYLLSTNYVNTSNASMFGFVYGASLPSTTSGIISSLGSLGYVSTQTLQSTSQGIQAAKQNIFIDRSGATNIFGSQVFISSVGAITFLSSFVNSTITYQGQNGLVSGNVTNNSNLYFSSASLQFDRFSSLITAESRITIELFPTYQFDTLTTGSIISKAVPMSTFIQYGPTYLSTFHQTQVAAITAQNGYSNFFQQPIKISIPGTQVIGSYSNPYVLTHSLPGGVSYQTNVGFRSGGVNVFFGSTNSYFLTVQNLSF
jgi:hypothetical protein